MSTHSRAPLLLRVAVRFLPSAARDEVLGDLLEERAARAEALSGVRLLLWDCRQVGAAIRWRIAAKKPSASLPDARRLGAVRSPTWTAPFSWLDVKLGVRMLRKKPLLTVVAGLTLALGIPSSLFPAHIMGILNASFPVEDGRRVVGLRYWDMETGRPAAGGLHEFAVWRQTLQSFESVGAARTGPWNVSSPDGRAEEVQGAEVSAAVFTMLRSPPLEGRFLLEADEARDASDVVVISQALWKSRFGGDPDIVGKTVGLGRMPHTVVGIMPEGFLFPRAEHFWLPLRLDPDAYSVGGGPNVQVYGRLADGVSPDAAEAELRTVGARLAMEWPETHTRRRAEVVTIGRLAMRAPATGWVQEVLVVQLICLGLLLIACGNVGTLVLARTAMRSGEMAVRTALGASRSRVLGQLFVELFVLAVVATGLGLIVADQVADYAVQAVMPSAPYWFDPSVGPRAVLLALGLAAACAVSAGVLPAWKATRASVQDNLKRTAAGSTVRFGFVPTVLIVTEVALSVGFLAMGTAVVSSTAPDRSTEMALDLDRHLLLSLRTPRHVLADSGVGGEPDAARARRAATREELKRRLLADPSARRVAMGRDMPGMPYPRDQRVEVEGRTLGDSELAPRTVVARVHHGFFEDLGRPILTGRGFTSADAVVDEAGHRSAVIVNTQFVQELLAGTEAIGRRIRYQDAREPERDRWYEIVGVVGDVAMNPHNPDRGGGVYHPIGATDVEPLQYIIEVVGDPVAFIPRARLIAAAVDPDAVVQNPRILSDLLDEARFESAIYALFISMLSVVGALLAATGLHALMSFTVSQRIREIGIRAALGASATNIVSTIATRAGAQLVAGVGLGVALGYRILTRGNDLFRTVPSVVGLVTIVGGAVLLIGALACLAPTLRGLRIQPTEALREEG